MKTKGVAHKPLFGRFSIPFLALSGADNSIQNRPNKGINREIIDTTRHNQLPSHYHNTNLPTSTPTKFDYPNILIHPPHNDRLLLIMTDLNQPLDKMGKNETASLV